MFLEFSQWSPRFDAAFYSIKMEGKELRSSPPDGFAAAGAPPGKDRHPAYYYLITVFREKEKKVIYRRYSQFRWLYDQIVNYKPPEPTPGGMPELEPIVIPPKTCPWQKIDDVFAQNRLEELRDFMTNILIRPGIASHPAVLQFLELRTTRGAEQQQQQSS
jgi:hypothetical protein